MNPNNFKVIRQNGDFYDLELLGVIVRIFIVDSPIPVNNFDTIDSRDGFIDLGTTYEGRTMRATFVIPSDFSRLRDELFKIFDSRELFYIIPIENPNIRYKVKCDSEFSLRRAEGETEIEFISPSAYAETAGTTLNPGDQFQVKETSFSDPPIEYSFDTDTFFIWNDGDVDIDPREYPLIVTFIGDSTNLIIENLTTEELFQYTGTTTTGDTFKLDGIRVLKNDASVYRNTNRKLVTLQKGWNEFKITGATNIEKISFDFRFYYL